MAPRLSLGGARELKRPALVSDAEPGEALPPRRLRDTGDTARHGFAAARCVDHRAMCRAAKWIQSGASVLQPPFGTQLEPVAQQGLADAAHFWSRRQNRGRGWQLLFKA